MNKDINPPIENGFVVQYRNPGDLDYHAIISPSVIKITSQENTPYYYKLYFDSLGNLTIEGEIPLIIKPTGSHSIKLSFGGS